VFGLALSVLPQRATGKAAWPSTRLRAIQKGGHRGLSKHSGRRVIGAFIIYGIELIARALHTLSH